MKMQLRPGAGMSPRKLLAGVALLAAAFAAPQIASAQTATIYGSLGNFDVANNTGHDACGFEMQVDGLDQANFGGGYGYQRYGVATTEAYAGGLFIRHKSSFDPVTHSCLNRTVAHPLGQNFAGTCYMGSPNYNSSGCEHFGFYFNVATPGTALMRWMAPDPTTPDTLVAVNPPVAVPVPSYYVIAPVVPGNPPQIEVVIDAPDPPEVVGQYGDAQWMRVFVSQVPREVTLDELLSNNAIVPQDLTQLESDWQIVQTEPPGGNRGRGRHRNRGNLLPTTRTIVRRIEMHEFTGSYDPATHEALCADLLCNAPAATEIGQQLSAQMTAVLVQSDSVTVTKAGNGQVGSADKRISCGNKCVAPYNAGTAVVLTAKAGSGSAFAGWAGACAGTQATCTVTATNHVDVSANFTVVAGGGGGGGGATGSPTLSVKLSGGKGRVTGTPGAINCGSVCSASVVAGTGVTLTATPDAGFRFVNWTGACTGSLPNCTVTVSSSGTAQANFAK